MMKANKIEQIQILKKVNDELNLLGLKAEIVIVGGSAFTLKGFLTRYTHDIDYLNNVSKEVENIFTKYGVNSRVKTFEIHFGDYTKDLTHFQEVSFKNLKVFMISDERLLASRIFSQKRLEDLLIVFKSSVSIDKNKFESIIEEVYSYTDPFLQDFKNNKLFIQQLYKERRWDYENSNIKKLLEK